MIKSSIKMLAAKKQMTLGELMLSYVEPNIPKKKVNKKTLKAHQEALEGKATAYQTMEDFWKVMGVKRRA
ncbi:MAG: hypothetical protein H0V82_12820 [Candidatus Protochlamydia sp.]|nr:hypothetical protein [Candidatus Protochlamydia sp.]